MNGELTHQEISRLYHELHRACPICGSTSIETTCVGHIMLDLETARDSNNATCLCGWSGEVHDMVSGRDLKVMWFGREEELVLIEVVGDFVSYDHNFLCVKRLGKRWGATIGEWWGDGTKPEGYGDTLEKAIAALEIEMKELYEYIKEIVEGVGVV